MSLYSPPAYYVSPNRFARKPRKAPAPRIEEAREFIESTCPDLVHAFTFASTDRSYGPILADMAKRLRQYGKLSEKQVEFARKLNADRDAKVAAQPAPEGEATFEGEVVSVKLSAGRFGDVLGMTVKTAPGYVVWLKVPAELDGIAKGQRVRITATLKPSADDPKFAIGKKPTAAEVVAA